MVLVAAEGNNWKLDYMMSKLFKKQKLHNVEKRKKNNENGKKVEWWINGMWYS